MTLNSLFFIIFSGILVLSSIFSMVSKRMTYTLLWAMMVFLMIAGLFLLLGASYNAMVQFLIYVVAIPVLIAVSIMLINSNNKENTFFRGKYSLWVLTGVFFLVLIIGEFLSLNNDFFEIIKNCSVYVNTYSDLSSVTRNILGGYPVLFLEFASGIVLTIIGLSHYGK